MNRIAMALTLALMAATPAVAQEHDQHQQHQQHQQHGEHGEHEGMKMMHHGMEAMHQGMASMHRGMAGMHCAMMDGTAPGMVLRHADHLGLSTDQVRQIETLRDRTHAAAMPHMRQAMTAHTGARALLDVDQPDLDAYEEGLRDAASHMVQAHAAMARAAVATRDVLSDEQRDQLTGMDHAMDHSMCPMMGAKKDGDAAHDDH